MFAPPPQTEAEKAIALYTKLIIANPNIAVMLERLAGGIKERLTESPSRENQQAVIEEVSNFEFVIKDGKLARPNSVSPPHAVHHYLFESFGAAIEKSSLTKEEVAAAPGLIQTIIGQICDQQLEAVRANQPLGKSRFTQPQADRALAWQQRELAKAAGAAGRTPSS